MIGNKLPYEANSKLAAFSVFRKKIDSWQVFSALALLLILVPVAYVIFYLPFGSKDSWHHLVTFLLPEYLLNTIGLCLISGGFSLVTGVGLAWMVTMYEFPYRKTLEWIFVLPLAIPAYIAAYAYHGFFEFGGSIGNAFFALGLIESPIFFRMDAYPFASAGLILGMVLYPYVYVISRSYFVKSSVSFLEVSRVMGNSTFSTFFKVIIPLARPAIFSGVVLVLMEVINDYGTVHFFGISTFTTGIFRAWFAFGDISMAIHLAAITLVVVFFILTLEKYQRKSASFSQQEGGYRPVPRIELSRLGKVIVLSISGIVLLFTFVIPVLQLFIWLFEESSMSNMSDVIWAAFNSFSLALVAALLIATVSLFVLFSYQLSKVAWLEKLTRFATIGYSVPGAVIAVGVLVPLNALDRQLNETLLWIGFSPVGLFFGSGLVMLIFAYMVRFFAVGTQPISANFEKQGARMIEVSRSLGRTPFSTLVDVISPIMKPAYFSALLLVFVDVMKELPLTLILRPFNFHTLSTKAFEMASIELLPQTAFPAIMIIFVGLLPVFLINRWALAK